MRTLRPLAVALGVVVAAAAAGCKVDPFDASGKQCRLPEDPCPLPLKCALTAQTETSSGGQNDGGNRAGLCQLPACSQVDCHFGEVCVDNDCYLAQCEKESCGANEVCVEKQCVDRSCVGVSCDGGTACAQGFCRPLNCSSGACNVDAGELCFEGACTDRRCLGVTCPEDQGCAQGRCYPEACTGTPCLDGALCVNNQCTERACLGVQCTNGLLCARGVCQRCGSGSIAAADGGCLTVTLLDAGVGCALGTDCKSGHCVNGNCCEAASCGVCQRCDVPDQKGTCAAAADGGPGCGGCSAATPCVTGQCEGGVCLVTHALNVSLDSWLAFIENKRWGNGKGPRLVVGASNYVQPTPNAGLNRALLRIPLTLPDGGLPAVGKIVSAHLKLRVRPNDTGDCWTSRSGAMFFVEELDTGFSENGYAVGCGVTANGATTALWPGPGSSTTNRGTFQSNGIAPTGWISVDLRPMVAAACAAGKTSLEVRLVAAKTDGTTDETTESRRIILHSRETTTPDAGPFLELKLTP